MSEIKYFLERKRDGPRGLVAWRWGHERDRSSNKIYFFNLKQYKIRWATSTQFFSTRDRSRPRQTAWGRALRVRAPGRHIPFSFLYCFNLKKRVCYYLAYL